MIRSVQSLFRRSATCLAVAAAFALVLNGALGADHHLAASPANSGHYHAHDHSHGPVDTSDHHAVDGDVADGVEVAAAHHHGFWPSSSPDAGANCCCFCASCAAIVLPCVSVQTAPFVLLRTMVIARGDHGDGLAPDGLRRPPRPLAIA